MLSVELSWDARWVIREEHRDIHLNIAMNVACVSQWHRCNVVSCGKRKTSSKSDSRHVSCLHSLTVNFTTKQLQPHQYSQHISLHQMFRPPHNCHLTTPIHLYLSTSSTSTNSRRMQAQYPRQPDVTHMFRTPTARTMHQQWRAASYPALTQGQPSRLTGRLRGVYIATGSSSTASLKSAMRRWPSPPHHSLPISLLHPFSISTKHNMKQPHHYKKIFWQCSNTLPHPFFTVHIPHPIS